jgi:hypothetical protein
MHNIEVRVIAQAFDARNEQRLGCAAYFLWRQHPNTLVSVPESMNGCKMEC